MTMNKNNTHPIAFYQCTACHFGKVPNEAAHGQAIPNAVLYQAHCMACGSTITIGKEVNGEYEPNHELTEWRDEVQS